MGANSDYQRSICDRCNDLPFDVMGKLDDENNTEFLDKKQKHIQGYVEQLLDRTLTWDDTMRFVEDEVDNAFNVGYLAGCLCGYREHAKLLNEKFGDG